MPIWDEFVKYVRDHNINVNLVKIDCGVNDHYKEYISGYPEILFQGNNEPFKVCTNGLTLQILLKLLADNFHI